MKKTSAVICELNPAHKGHEFIINEAKKRSECVIAVMSGNFVQRAETAIYDKYRRAADALKLGADIVLELPFPWACASAEYFAAAGVEVAEKTGCELLVFGSECGDKEALVRAAEILKREEFNSPLQPDIRAAEQRQKMLLEADCTLPPALLSSKNDILGIEYCKNLHIAEPCPIKRISCESATAIRSQMNENILAFADAIDVNKLFELEFVKLRCEKAAVFETAESGGGVGERLWKSAFSAKNSLEMFENAKTKQYTNARLRRAALFYLMNIFPSQIREKPLYTCLLAANEKGRAHLSDVRKTNGNFIITKPADGKKLAENARKQFENATFADSIFALCAGLDADYYIKKSPIIT